MPGTVASGSSLPSSPLMKGRQGADPLCDNCWGRAPYLEDLAINMSPLRTCTQAAVGASEDLSIEVEDLALENNVASSPRVATAR